MAIENIYRGLPRPRAEGLATLGDFFDRFQQAREDRQVNKDREAARALQQQDRQLRQQEIDLRNTQIQATNKKLKTDEEKLAATRALIQQHTGPDGLVDYEAVSNGLGAIDLDAKAELDKHLDERAAARRKAELDKLTQQKTELEVREAQLKADQADVKTWLERYATLKDDTQKADFWQDVSESKMLSKLKTAGLSTTSTPDDAAGLILGAKGRDDAAARATDDARQAAAAAEAARHNRVMEARQPGPASEPLEPVIDPKTGLPVLRRRSAAEGMRPATSREQPTEDERKSAGFYRQMQEAIQILDEVEGQLTQKDLYQIQTLPQEEIVGMINRGQMSEAAKRYFRAFEQFTESRLRPVSGAAISDSEFARDRRTYAKQYAETEQLAKDRKKARNSALESLKARASRALPTKDAAGSDPMGIR